MSPQRTAPKPATTGRPTLLTPAVETSICDHIRAGSHLNVAAQVVGVAPETISEWKQWGRRDEQAGKPDTPYARFWKAVAQAEAQSEFAGVMRIRRAGEADWRAEAWFMERRFPERWVGRQTFTVESASVEGPINADFVLSGKAGEVVDAVFDAFESQRMPRLTSGDHD